MSLLPRRLILATVLLIGGASSRPSQDPSSMHAVDRSRLDTTCAPCKDFYRFANGAWLDRVTIPPDRDTWGPLAELQQRNQAFIGLMLDSLAYAPERHARNEVERKIGTFFRACMDSAARGATALRQLEPELNRIAAIGSAADLGGAVGRLSRYNVHVVFSVGQTPDANDRLEIALRAFWNAFSFPFLNQYRAGDSTSVRVRGAFVAMLTRVFEGLGDPPDTAGLNARRVLAFETALIDVRLADSGGVSVAMADLRREGSAFDWHAFVRELGRPDAPSLVVRPPGMVAAIDSLASGLPLANWKAYLRWRLVLAIAPGLDIFHDGVGAFYRMVSGRQQDPSRGAQCASTTSASFGDGVAHAFVGRRVPTRTRAAARAMIEQMRGVLRERIARLDWLGPASRARALTKLNTMSLQVGYPDEWVDYGGLEVRDGAAAANLLAARRYAMDRGMALVGTRGDRQHWGGEAMFASGDYSAESNTLSVTAAILLPPFFDPNADPAANYGAIGQLIGHELTHAFDSNGRLYNEFGKRADWWSPGEVAGYIRRQGLVVQQYDQFIIAGALHPNGRATLSENIADIGGIELAWLAYQHATTAKPHPVRDGFTAEQRFFVAYAQTVNTEVWRQSLLQSQTQIDNYSHSAPAPRVNGPLANLQAFAAAFGCNVGDPMVRPDSLRWSIW